MTPLPCGPSPNSCPAFEFPGRLVSREKKRPSSSAYSKPTSSVELPVCRGRSCAGAPRQGQHQVGFGTASVCRYVRWPDAVQRRARYAMSARGTRLCACCRSSPGAPRRGAGVGRSSYQRVTVSSTTFASAGPKSKCRNERAVVDLPRPHAGRLVRIGPDDVGVDHAEFQLAFAASFGAVQWRSSRISAESTPRQMTRRAVLPVELLSRRSALRVDLAEDLFRPVSARGRPRKERLRCTAVGMRLGRGAGELTFDAGRLSTRTVERDSDPDPCRGSSRAEYAHCSPALRRHRLVNRAIVLHPTNHDVSQRCG